MRTILLHVAATLLCVGTAAAQNPTPGSWERFRSYNPFHVQTIAVGTNGNDGTRTLIISEPPPQATLQEFVALNPRLLATATVKRHRIGFDGWVKDIVVTLPAVTPIQWRELVDQISYYLYGTTYKAFTAPIAPPSAPSSVVLDLRVSSADLRRWLFDDRFTFRGLGDTSASTIKQLLDGERDGVYLSETRGLVAWVLPRKRDYASLRREGRQFALDSDLIVGAVATPTYFAVIARERLVPISVLPPLRFETILQLSNVSSDSLAQSYERKYVLAGRFDKDKDLDWAPIYLSDALIDTEYGSLLNLTDQLLKSWSMAGQIEYSNFDYPKPATFPFKTGLANEPAIRKTIEEGTSGLTFNWNTAGAGYVVDASADTRIFALNRTGALPISYLTKDDANSRYETAAYDWFAGKTLDPNLARVVQYASLYQIFHEFHVLDGPQPLIPSKQPKTKAVADLIEASLTQLIKADCDDDSISTHTRREADEHRLKHLFEMREMEHICELLLLGASDQPALRSLANVMAGGTRSDSDLNLLRSVFSRSKETRDAFVNSLPAERQQRLDALLVAQELNKEGAFRRALGQRISLLKARDLFVSGASRPEVGWIRTSSVVISRPKGIFRSYVGGHNLDAKIGRFVDDPTVRSGEIRVVRIKGERVVHYNPADQARLPNWLRDAAMIQDDAQLARRVASTAMQPLAVTANQPMAVALKLTPAAAGDRGLTTGLTGGTSPDLAGWGRAMQAGARETAIAATLSHLPGRVINVERFDQGFYRIVEGQTGRVYQARSMTDVLDLVTASLKRAPGKPPTKLLLAGFSESDAVNFRRSAEQLMKREGQSGQRLLASVGSDVEAGGVRMFEKVAQADLTRAQFGTWELRDIELAPGRAGKVWETAIEAPPAVGRVRGFLIRIRMYFESLFPTALQLRSAQPIVTAAFTKLPADATLNEAAAALERELRIKFPGLDSVVLEAAGVLFVERDLPRQPNDARFAD